MKLSSIPAGEAGLPKAFGVPGVAIVTRRPSSKAGDHKNIIATMAVDPCPATTLLPAGIRSDATQVLIYNTFFACQHAITWHHCREADIPREDKDAIVARPRRTTAESFVWSPTRPANRLCLHRRSPIHASSIWSGCWRDRLHGTSFKPKRIAGSETASQNKEVAS